MADPTQQNSSSSSSSSTDKPNAGAASARGAAQASAPPSGPRNYDLGDHGEVQSRSAQAAQVEQVGREVAQAARRGGREVADFWRASLEPFALLQMDANRLFDEVWRQATGMAALPAMRAARPFAATTAAPFFGQPATDAKETDKAYVLTIELPGLKREDIDLQLRGDAILVSGHKAEERDDSGSTYRISERRFGRFERSFPIPPDVDRERIEAEFKDGVLRISLAKDEVSGPQNARIEVR